MQVRLTFLPSVLALTLAVSGSVSAQEAAAPAEKAVLTPATSDIGLGFNAVPMLRYVGNTFNGSTSNTAYTSFVDGSQSIFVKYVMAPQQVIRLRVNPTMTRTTLHSEVPNDDAESRDPGDTVTDTAHSSSAGIDIGGGLEMRRGGRRIQGFYGAEARLSLSNSKASYEYGNAMEEDNPSPTSTDFINGGVYGNDTRILTDNPGAVFGFGLRGFVGLEYFIAPQISLGGEFGWGPMVTKLGEGSREIEWWDYSEDESNTSTQTFLSDGYFSAGTDVMDGAIVLMFYF